MPISLLFDLANYTPADASPVQSNFQQIENYLNTEVITRDGLVAMTAQLRLVNSNPVNVLDAASKGYVDAIFPVGVILPFAGSAVPAGRWLACDGSLVSRATYAALFAVIGVQYGAGDGSTTFALPNTRGRVMVPVSPGGAAEVDTIGETGGATTHTLTSAQIPAHNHAFSATSGNQSANHEHNFAATTSAVGNHTHNYDRRATVGSGAAGGGPMESVAANVSTASGGGGAHDHSVSGTTSGVSVNHTHSVSGTTSNNAGGGSSHNNMQPYIVLGPSIIRY